MFLGQSKINILQQILFCCLQDRNIWDFLVSLVLPFWRFCYFRYRVIPAQWVPQDSPIFQWNFGLNLILSNEGVKDSLIFGYGYRQGKAIINFDSDIVSDQFGKFSGLLSLKTLISSLSGPKALDWLSQHFYAQFPNTFPPSFCPHNAQSPVLALALAWKFCTLYGIFFPRVLWTSFLFILWGDVRGGCLWVSNGLLGLPLDILFHRTGCSNLRNSDNWMLVVVWILCGCNRLCEIFEGFSSSWTVRSASSPRTKCRNGKFQPRVSWTQVFWFRVLCRWFYPLTWVHQGNEKQFLVSSIGLLVENFPFEYHHGQSQVLNDRNRYITKCPKHISWCCWCWSRQILKQVRIRNIP